MRALLREPRTEPVECLLRLAQPTARLHPQTFRRGSQPEPKRHKLRAAAGSQALQALQLGADRRWRNGWLLGVGEAALQALLGQVHV